MVLRYPLYFENFRCIADKCPDSCCKEWDVYVDEASAARYIDFPGPLGEDLRRYMQQDADGDWFFAITDGRCPFWRADGLCRIQAQCGHEALCATCRDFPRLTHDYGDFVEKGLSLSCPAAAPLILEKAAAQWKTRELPGGEAPEYDRQDMHILLESREGIRKILTADSYTVPEALALALLYAYQAQAALDVGDPAIPSPDTLADAYALAAQAGRRADPAELMVFYLDLEILTQRWRSLLTHPQGDGSWDERLRALACYGVDRWWLQAISDLDLVGRAKMVISSCILLHFLGGDLTQTAQLYSKEIENDADNVDAILDGAYASPALTDDKLLGWLLL